MKTYFLAYEASNKRGHCIYEFHNPIPPREALRVMLDFVRAEFDKTTSPIRGEINATQFNRVD